MKKSFIFLVGLTLLASVANAKSQNHYHAGRSHTHPLPNQGIKHHHGNGAYGSDIEKGTANSSVSNISRTTPSNKGFVRVTDSNKLTLVGSVGGNYVDTKSCIDKLCGQAIYIYLVAHTKTHSLL